jgi:NADH dehydrogenase FAD-containing subunit
LYEQVRTSARVGAIVDYGTSKADGAHHICVQLTDEATQVEEEIDFGMLVWSAGTVPFSLYTRLAVLIVWSAGVHPVKFVQRMEEAKGAGGRLAVDGCLRVAGREGRVFAIGDAAVYPAAPLPPIAQKAEQEAKYLAQCLNDHYHSLATASDASGVQPINSAAY